MSFNPKVALYSGQTQNIDYTPGSAVSAGDVIVINGIAHFAQRDIPANTLGALAFAGGTWAGNKASGAISKADALYWNPTGNPNVGTAGTGAITNAYAAGYTFLGYATADAASADQYVYFDKANGQSGPLRTIAGQITTVTASDTVVTGLNHVVSVVASLEDAPVTGCETAGGAIGDQAGSPAAGSVLIKTWMTLGGTPAAATTFGKKVNWVALGY